MRRLGDKCTDKKTIYKLRKAVWEKPSLWYLDLGHGTFGAVGK